MTIYRSQVPDIDLGPPVGLFTYTFGNAREHDPTTPAFIDAVCGEKYSRKEFYDLCLRFAYGVKQWGEKRGQVAMVFRHVQPSFTVGRPSHQTPSPCCSLSISMNTACITTRLQS